MSEWCGTAWGAACSRLCSYCWKDRSLNGARLALRWSETKLGAAVHFSPLLFVSVDTWSYSLWGWLLLVLTGLSKLAFNECAVPSPNYVLALSWKHLSPCWFREGLCDTKALTFSPSCEVVSFFGVGCVLFLSSLQTQTGCKRFMSEISFIFLCSMDVLITEVWANEVLLLV